MIFKTVARGSVLGVIAYATYKTRYHSILFNATNALTLPQTENDAEKYWNTALFFPNHFPEREDSDTRRLIWFLEQSTESLDLCLFSLSFRLLEDALARVSEKGVTVKLLTNREMNSKRHRQAGIQCRTKIHCFMNPKAPNMYLDLLHHKFVVIDNAAVIVGSLNWTKAGITENKENVIITTHEGTVQKYAKEFHRLWDESRKESQERARA